MSKKNAATWKRYTEEPAVLGNQSIFLLLHQAVPMSAYFTSVLWNPLLSDILESIYSQKKLSRAHTEN